MKVITVTDIGLVRKENQDQLATASQKHAFLAVVCDGIGGANAGSVASKIACEELVTLFKKSEDFTSNEEVKDWFSNSIKIINDKLYNLSKNYRSYRGMGTTMIAAVIFEHGGIAFNIGDSRIYMLKDKQLKCMSQDQTYAFEMYKRNQISYEETKVHPKRNVLMNALGIDQNVDYEIIDIPKRWDKLLLSSDGLHGFVDHFKLEKMLAQERVENLESLLLEEVYIEGAYDNISFIVIEGDQE